MELVIEPGEQAIHREFEFGPDGRELHLPRIKPDPANKKTWFKPA